MARIRTIKPSFWTDDAITECSISARLLFIGMLNFADDSGNQQRSSKQLRMKIFPADNIDVEPLVQELLAQRLIREYEVDGDKYLNIRNFSVHQVISRPSKFRVAPPENHGTLHECSVSAPGGLIVGRERERERDIISCPISSDEKCDSSDLSGSSSKAKKATGDYGSDFLKFWAAYPRKEGKGAAAKAWEKRRPPLTAVLLALEWQKQSDQWLREGGQYCPMPLTYINQKRWEDDAPAPTTPTEPARRLAF